MNDMRTARKEASAVTSHWLRGNLDKMTETAERPERNCPWSQPSIAAIAFGLGISRDLGIGRVPV